MHLRMMALFLGVCVGVSDLVRADDLQIVSLDPAIHAGNIPLDATVTVHFDRPVDPASITPASFRVFGRWSGAATGPFSFSNGNQSVTLTPTRSYSAGEPVFVNLANTIVADDASPLRSAGHAHTFWTAVAPGSLLFDTVDTISVRADGEGSTRIYGGQGSDLDGDGWLDLSIINEVSADIRVLMNKADGSGGFDDFLAPPATTGALPSPNEPADFNGDGYTDICTANVVGASVSVVLGNGDGTFGPHQEIAVGSGPHGLAVLDADGDGDMDIASANTGAGNVSLMLNNGSGVLGPATSFEGGGTGEYALTAGDMNNDGISDLIVGARTSQQIIVQLGNGDGTFTNTSTQSAGGSVWMIVAGDVNSDGFLDITCANSHSNSGSILLGLGNGMLSAPTVVPTASHVVATDLNDFDGDGDPDWVLSSFGGGTWRLFTNDGDGNFAFDQEFLAPSNPACAVILDFDNDRDLDLALLDEIADVVILKRNRGPVIPGDMNCDGRVDAKDIGPFVTAILDPVTYGTTFPGCLLSNGDTDGNTMTNTSDIASFVQLLTAQ